MRRDTQRRYARFFGSRPEADVEDEIAFHLEMRTRELIASGMTEESARAEAQRRFGDRARLELEMRRMEREKTQRDVRRRVWRDWGSDLSFVVRSLVRQPLFTISAVLTLGLSIGVNAAIFSAVNAFLLKPLPVAGADRQMVVALGSKKESITGNVSYPFYREVKELPVFEDAVAWLGWEVALRQGTHIERGFVLAGSGNYLTSLGIRPLLGRVFTEADAARREQVVLITHSYWAREFDSDRGVLGRTLYLNDAPFTIIGVLPAEFSGTQPLVIPHVLMPVTSMSTFFPAIDANLENFEYGTFRVLARAKPGVTPVQIQDVISQFSADLERRYPTEMAELRVVAAPETRARPDLSVAGVIPWIAGIFFAMVGLAVLVACANVANLLLVRATARRSEIAVRAALGAARARVIRLLLTESVAIGAMSLVVAYAFARFSIYWLDHLDLDVGIPVSFGLEMDWRVFGYAALLSLAAGAVAGLAPALIGSRAPVSDVLRESGRSGSGSKGSATFRNGLVVAQVAVSFVLLVSGGLLMRSARGARDLDLGFKKEQLLVSQIDLSLHNMDSTASRRVQDRVLDGLRALPNVDHAGLGTHIPLGGNNSTLNVHVDTRPAAAPKGSMMSFQAQVSPGFVPALGLRLRAGRDFAATDDDNTPRVAMVNDALAAALWPGEEAIGKRFRLSEQGAEVAIVGVVENSQFVFLGEQPRPMTYLPLRQHPAKSTFIFVRTKSPDPLTVAPDLRRILSDIDPNIMVVGTRSMMTHLEKGIALFFVNMGATLATAIGVLVLLQTIVGLYGVLSYTVAQRSKEFGIRQALGAPSTTIVSQVLRQGSWLSGLGLVLGAVLALASTRVMSSILYATSPTDAVAFGGAVLVVSVVALLSSYIPARRASRVAPATALRSD